MSNDMPEARWKQVCAQAKRWFDRLTDDDLSKVGGKADRLADILQERYGYIRQHAESQSNWWMQGHQQKPAPRRGAKK
jgi:uncharacterized protein YjbJ (UPF0337 family)